MRLSGDYRNHAGVIRVTLRAAPGPPSTVKRVPMFRTIALLLTMLVALAAGVALAPSVAQARYASIAVDVDSGQVLHAVNAATPNYPASLTKMMTLYLLFEALENRKSVEQGKRVAVRVNIGGRRNNK